MHRYITSQETIEHRIKRHIIAIKLIIGILVIMFIFFGGLLLSLIVKDPMVGLVPSLIVGMAFLYPLIWPHFVLPMILIINIEIIQIWASYVVTSYLQWYSGVIIEMTSQLEMLQFRGTPIG